MCRTDAFFVSSTENRVYVVGDGSSSAMEYVYVKQGENKRERIEESGSKCETLKKLKLDERRREKCWRIECIVSFGRFNLDSAKTQ